MSIKRQRSVIVIFLLHSISSYEVDYTENLLLRAQFSSIELTWAHLSSLVSAGAFTFLLLHHPVWCLILCSSNLTHCCIENQKYLCKKNYRFCKLLHCSSRKFYTLHSGPVRVIFCMAIIGKEAFTSILPLMIGMHSSGPHELDFRRTVR